MTLRNVKLFSELCGDFFRWMFIPPAWYWLIKPEWRIYVSVKLSSLVQIMACPLGRRQASIWTNAGILLIGPLGINFNEILIEINTFSFKKMHLKMSSAKWRPFRLGLNVLTHLLQDKMSTIWQTIVLDAFCEWKCCIRLEFHWSLFLRGQLTT